MANDDFGASDDATLVRDLAVKQRELVQSRFRHSMGRLENTASLGNLRKAIARIQTELRRREIAAGMPKETLVKRHKVDKATFKGASAAQPAAGGLLSGLVDKASE